MAASPTDTPLETSLVEWKLGRGKRHRESPGTLGNFLSGMETTATSVVVLELEPPWKLP